MGLFLTRTLLLVASIAGLISTPVRAEEPNLLIYCGITMVRPITELARIFEQREKMRITISQGGSEDLYQSAKRSRLGDLYLPGEPSYRAKYLAEGLLGEYKIVGYNQMSIFVQKGNPKGVRADLNELLRKDLALILGNAESGSVGQETKTILDKAGLYPRAITKAVLLMPDSRAINLAMKRHEADITLNWRATAFFPENIAQIDAIALDPNLANLQPLMLTLLSFSKNPAAARKFIDYVASPDGQQVFQKFGFLVDSRH